MSEPARTGILVDCGRKKNRKGGKRYILGVYGRKKNPLLQDRNQKNDSKATFLFLSEFREIEK